MFPKIGVFAPNHPFVHRVWNHYFHHPFWGTTIFRNTHLALTNINICFLIKKLIKYKGLFFVSFEKKRHEEVLFDQKISMRLQKHIIQRIEAWKTYFRRKWRLGRGCGFLLGSRCCLGCYLTKSISEFDII